MKMDRQELIIRLESLQGALRLARNEALHIMDALREDDSIPKELVDRYAHDILKGIDFAPTRLIMLKHEIKRLDSKA